MAHAGTGVEKDERMAVKYFRSAAALGFAMAQHNLAHCLFHANGCKQDIPKAIKVCFCVVLHRRLFSTAQTHRASFSLFVCAMHSGGVQQ